MPLNPTELTGARGVLSAWCDAVAGALTARLAGGGALVAEVDYRPRACATAPVPHPTAPTLTAPARFTDRAEVTVRERAGGRVVAAVLFATADNKADSDGALVFAVRVAGYMSAGVGVVVVDPLPGAANWATHLQSLAPVYPITRRPRNGEAPVVVIRPESRDGAEHYLVWHGNVPPGAPLPTVPVPLPGSAELELDLEATCLEACQKSRTA
jgi:hypothetical protein